MSNTVQKLTQSGRTPLVEAAGTGQERRRVDPELRNAQGQRIAPNTISVADGFEVVSIQDDPLDPFFGTFDVQNRLMISARCAWEASNLHTIQKPFPQDASETFGILGGGVFPPLPFSGGGGGGGYDDSLFLPQYGNPVAVDTTQAALDANKRTLRRLTYAPHIAPSLPPSPDVFASWQALYDAYTAQGDNPCDICFINPPTAPSPLSIPAGTWRFKDGDIFIGLGQEAGILPTVVFLDEDCLIVNVHTFKSLSILGQTSTNPQLAWDTYPETMGITLDDTEWGNTGSAPMIRWDGDPLLSEVLLLRLLNGSKIQRLAFEVVELFPNPNPPSVIVQMLGCSEVESATFRGEGDISFRVRSQGAMPNLDQPNLVTVTPLASPALFRQRAQRRVLISNNPDSPYDNGDTVALEIGEIALLAPTTNGGAPITLFLPPASLVPCVTMGGKKINGDTQTVVSFQAIDAGTIDGSPSYDLPLGAYQSVQFFSDGQNWYTLGGNMSECAATNPMWQTIYQQDFSTLANQTFAADGAYLIGGKIWNLWNRALATDASVGPATGGLSVDIPAATIRNYFSGRNSPYWALTFLEMLAGTPFEGAQETELRITARLATDGGFTGTFNNRYHGAQTRVQNGGYYHWIYQGLPDRGFFSQLPNNLFGTDLTFAALGYYPNVSRLSFLGNNLRKIEYSSTVAASIDTATMLSARWGQPAASFTPILVDGQSNNMEFFFAFNADNINNTATRTRLEEIKIEARINPYRALLFLM